MEYYLHYECPKCGNDIYRLHINTIQHRGLPVFELDEFKQIHVMCNSCHANIGIGDIDMFVDGWRENK